MACTKNSYTRIGVPITVCTDPPIILVAAAPPSPPSSGSLSNSPGESTPSSSGGNSSGDGGSSSIGGDGAGARTGAIVGAVVGAIASVVVITGAVLLYRRRGDGAAWGWLPAWASNWGSRGKSPLVNGNSLDGVSEVGDSGAGIGGSGRRSGVVIVTRGGEGQGGGDGEGETGSHSMGAAAIDAAVVTLDVASAEGVEGVESVGGTAERCLLASEAVRKGTLTAVASRARCQQLATGVAHLVPKLQEIHRQAQQQGYR